VTTSLGSRCFVDAPLSFARHLYINDAAMLGGKRAMSGHTQQLKKEPGNPRLCAFFRIEHTTS